MRPRRAFLLVEVLIALTILATAGAALLRSQVLATRQLQRARELDLVTQRLTTLLQEWSESGEPVDLPRSGELAPGYSWERRSQLVRVASDLLATRVELAVWHHTPGEPDRQITTLVWLAPREALP